MRANRAQIEAILEEQIRLVCAEKGAAPAVAAPTAAPAVRRPGRPRKNAAAIPAKPAAAGRRPGRQPSIIRDSSLNLKASDVAQLRGALTAAAGDGKLGKDATVFAIAYHLCTRILKSDTFSAGDVIAAYKALGSLDCAPAAGEVDVVQMLRNLAATSIGKVWVARTDDGKFTLTKKGQAAGQSGQIVRPRGRRPKGAVAPKRAAKQTGAKRGRPKGSKNAVKKAAKKTGAKMGRPKGSKNAVKAPVKRGRPKGSKNAVKAPVKRGRPKGSKNAVKTVAKRGRPKGSKNAPKV
jgi:hypothetical protein